MPRKAKTPKKEEDEEEEEEEDHHEEEAAAPSKKKAPAAAKATKRAKLAPKEEEEEEARETVGDYHVVITSSKACQAFAKHADKLHTLIKKSIPAVKVQINTEKKISSNPDRGTFAVQVKGKTLVEHKAMPRPFKAMKEMDMEALAQQIVKELAW